MDAGPEPLEVTEDFPSADKLGWRSVRREPAGEEGLERAEA